MADNYLEKKMEDYRRGALKARFNHRSHGEFHGLRVAMAGEPRNDMLHIASMLAMREARVAICTEGGEGAKVAQRAGARYYPCNPADFSSLVRVLAAIRDYFDGMDVLIAVSGGYCERAVYSFAESQLEGSEPLVLSLPALSSHEAQSEVLALIREYRAKQNRK